MRVFEFKTSFAWILLLAAFLFFFQLGDRSFRNPDEGRYAEIAKEMVLSGNWLEPKLYGVDYLRKPILFYWLLAGSFKLFGFNEWSARVVPALFGFLGVVLTYLFSRKVFGKETALASALILITNIWYLSVSRYLLIDSVFSFFLVGAFYAFYLGMSLPFYLCLALAFLAKGPAAIAIMILSLGIYLFFSKKKTEVFSGQKLGTGILIFCAVALPWFIYISLHKPDFLNFFFIHEQFQRFTSKEFEHQEPFYFYFMILPAVFFPWFFFIHLYKRILSNLKESISKDATLYLLSCSLAVVLFYSFSGSKLATYILPVIPLISILLGAAWVLERKMQKFFSTIIVFLALIAMLVPSVMARMNGDYTTKPFAQFLEPRLEANDLVLIYDHPGALYDFGFYLNHPVKLVGLEGELELSRNSPEAKNEVISHEEFLKMVGQKKFYCLMRKSDYTGLDASVRDKTRVLQEDRRKVLMESVVQ